MNLLRFGFNQFKQITLITHIDELRKLSNSVDNGEAPDHEKIAFFGFNKLSNLLKEEMYTNLSTKIEL